MSSQVTLTITHGKLSGKQYLFESRSSCVVGRNDDCNLQIANSVDMTVSRYHCLFDINPPDVRVRDLGSLNGTYVNGTKIGQREPDQTPEEAGKIVFPEYDLQNGDKIELGDIVFSVGIKVELPENPTPNFAINQNSDQVNFFDWVKRLLNLATPNNDLKAISGYQLIKSLGKGGFGEVFLAQNSQSGKYVALKVMLPAVARQERCIKMFLRETENTKILQHPHVVQLLDYGFAEGIFFFTMEYCNSGNVEQLMEKSGGRLPVNLAIAIILQVLDGLIYAHEVEVPYVKLADGTFGQGKGLVHRDLKPSNIFLIQQDEKLIAKIGDYGLAKAFDLAGLSGQTLTGTTAGSPAFMPRQQLLDFKHVLPEVDVWATAACFYYMVTGDSPRDFTTTKDVWLAVLQNDPVPILQRNGSIPEKLAEVIDLALVEKPQLYFSTADGFKRALLDSL